MDELVVMLQVAEGPESVPDRLRMLPRVILTGEEWAFRRRFEPAALEHSLAALFGARDVTVQSVGVLPPRRGHAVARVCARVDGVIHDIHAEGVGAGYFGRHALAVADRLTDFVPRIYGLRDGLLFREWLPEGLRLTPERLRADPIPAATTIARYVDTRSRRLETTEDVALRLGGREAAWEHTAQLFGDAFGGARKLVRPLTEPAARRVIRVTHPSVGDARTVPWEWFGDASSGLRKATFQQRATASRGLQSYDPVFDLAEAAAAAEAVGDLEFAGELLAAYEEESATVVEPERWLIHRLVHHLDAHRAALKEVAAGDGAPAAFAHALALERAMAGIQRRYAARPAGPPPSLGPLCAIDIDGVLESRWAVFPAITPAGAEALRALRVHGRRAVLVTGRSLDEVRERCADYGLAGGSGEYGSVVYDAHTGAHRSLLSPAAQAALSALRGVLEQTPGILLDPVHRHSVRAHTTGARGARRALDAAAIAAALEAAGVADRVRVAQGVLQTDFVAAEIDKAVGLRALASDLGAVRNGEPDVAFAIGDTAEDLPMLRLARNPWAPANAAPELHDHAQITRAAYQPGLLAAVRAEVGHARSDCETCRAPAPPTREAALLRATLTALGGGRRVKAQQAVVLAARLVRISPSS
jgi:hydroxymethylpyrimidine pyrophosphatase-like HAD family hydrolase